MQNKPSMQYMHLSGFKWHSSCIWTTRTLINPTCLVSFSLSFSLSGQFGNNWCRRFRVCVISVQRFQRQHPEAPQLESVLPSCDHVCVCVCVCVCLSVCLPVCLSVCVCATYYPHQQLFHVFYGGVARTLLGRDIWTQRDPVHTMYHTI